MSNDFSQAGEQGGGLFTSGREASSGASDFEDSFLRELRQSEPLPLLPVPGERLGGHDGRRYEVLAWMGGGGMGQVFRARDEMLRREVALKFLVLRGAFEEEVLREARAIARLDHEHIVRIFDVSEWSAVPGEERVPFLVMECLEGESLATLLKRGRLEVGRALEILDAMAAGLEHAHERHLVHRDLKPSNVFLTPQGAVKLLDFGLAHLMVASGPDAPRLPIAGTPPYMAPEQWRGSPQDARTDVWAVGVVLYEMLTGTVPYLDTTLRGLRERVMSGEPVPSVRARRPEVPPEVEGLLSKLLAKEPARRFPTARELREESGELRARLAGSGFEGPHPMNRQRRQVTLVSCRLAGLAGLAERLNAEGLDELESAFREDCAQGVERHGGSLLLSMGGEVFACFGYPRVREDDAERAVRAALSLVHDLPETLQRKLPHLLRSELGACGGLHTARMVLDTRTLQGEAPRVVSWLAGQAGPGEVLVGGTAWTQVRGAFETESLGLRTFTGLAGPTPLAVHRVVRERESRVRFERALVAGGLTPLVGREDELRWLLEQWARARDGQGAFALLSGEAGIGKSRLIQELRERVPPGSATCLRLQFQSQLSTSPLPAFVELLQSLLGLSLEGSPSQRLRELEVRLGTMGLSGQHVQLLGLLLSLPVPEDAPVYRLTHERRREKTHEVLVDLLLHVARRHPVLAIVEDLHWVDSSWLEFLGVLLERIEGARLLVVLSARPEFQPSWPAHVWFHRLTVERLSVGLAASLVKEAARGRALPEETVRALVEKTDGIPFYIEEMTRMVLEGGAAASIPVTLHELLLARLDMLSSRQKALVQLGAVVGRDFPLELLEAATGQEAVDLRRELAGMVEVGLLQAEQDGTGEPRYQFRHALFQEAAYQSLPLSERRQHHRRIAQALEERWPDVVEARPEVLARHYMEAGEHARAIAHWGRAGLLAIQHMGVPEAVGHYSRALELLRSQPEATRHPGEELLVAAALGYAQVLRWGFDSPEAARTYARAWELLQRMDEVTPQPEPCFWSIFNYHMARAEYSRCHELAERVVRQGERQHAPGLLAHGHQMMAIDFSYRGHTRSALECSKRAMAYARLFLEQHQELSAWQAGAVWVPILTYTSFTHSMSGLLEQAREYGQQAVEQARRLGEPTLLSCAMSFTAMACFIRREVRETLRWADEVLTIISERNSKPCFEWVWVVVRGWAQAELWPSREGPALLAREAARLRALGVRGGQTYCLGVLAAAHLKLGEVREGLAVVEEALDVARRTGERGFECELRRMRGELLRARGQEREARQAFLHAIALARGQGSLICELRATVGLGRLLRDLGRPEVTRKLLVRSLARFPERVDSADLSEARALREQLSA